MLGTYFLGFGTVSFLYFQANDQIEALGGDNCDMQLGTFMGKTWWEETSCNLLLQNWHFHPADIKVRLVW